MAIGSDIINWTADSSLVGAYSATVNVSDPNSEYGQDLRTTPLEVALVCTADTFQINGDTSCFSGTKFWIRGLIGSVDEANAISDRPCTLQLRSYFARLSLKPINTESDVGTANAALTTVATEFGGIPVALLDFSVEALDICGPISGNSILEEMRRIAQAGRGVLFVSEEGLLLARQWKDHDSTVDTVIPDEAIINASRSRSDESLPSRIKIRGCFYTEYNKGVQYTSNDKTGSDRGGMGESFGGPVKCIQNGIPTEGIELEVKVGRGDNFDYMNAEVEVSSTTGYQDQVEFIPRSERGSVGIKLTPSSGYAQYEDDEVSVGIKGKYRHPKEHEMTEDYAHKPLDNEVGNNKKQMDLLCKMLGVRRHAGLSPANGGGARNSGGNRAQAKYSDEAVEVQIETTVDDPDLFAEYGHSVEEMQNIYVPNLETLFDIAVRRFQEIKMERNAWTVQTAYLPCVALNQVVTFKTPKLTTGTQKTITGLIVAISVNYNVDPNAAMTLTILSFEDIGSTVYSSGNLIRDYRMPAAGGSDSDWSTTGRGRVQAGRGRIRTSIADGATAHSIILTQEGMKVGDEYTLSWVQVDKRLTWDGGTSPDLTFTAPGHSSSKGAGSHSVTFTASATSEEIKWIQDNTLGAASALWEIHSPYLTKTVTA